MSHPHPELGTPPPLPKGGLRVVALGGLGEIGRNMTVFEHARPAAGRRLRRALPRGAPARRRRHPPRLHLDPGPARRHRRHRADPRPRGPHRRRAVPAARAPGHPAGRLEADAGVHRGQAQGAPDQADHRRGDRGRPAVVRRRSTASSLPSTTRSRTASPWRSAPARAWCCTPATSRWTSSRSTTGSPTCGPSRGFGEEGVDLLPHRLHQRRGARLHDVRARPHAGDRARSSGPPRGGSSSPASPATCTASSRSSTPPHAHGRKVAFVGRSMVRNMGIARDLGYLTVPDGPGRRHEGAREAAGRQGHARLHRLPGRADGRAGADGQPRPPDPDRPRRHRAAGQRR